MALSCICCASIFAPNASKARWIPPSCVNGATIDRASAQSATPAGQRISCYCAKQFISCLWVEPLAGRFAHGVWTFLLHTFHYFLLFRRQQCLDVVQLLDEDRPELAVELADFLQQAIGRADVDIVGVERAAKIVEGRFQLIFTGSIFLYVVVAQLGELLDLAIGQHERPGHFENMLGGVVSAKRVHVMSFAMAHLLTGIKIPRSVMPGHLGIGGGRCYQRRAKNDGCQPT